MQSPGSCFVGGRARSSNNSRYVDPFDDIASRSMPTDIESSFEVAERVFSQEGTYSRAIERVVSYFITDIEFSDVGDEEKDKWEEFAENELDILQEIKHGLTNRICYGNLFLSIRLRFHRFLQCPGDGERKCSVLAKFSEVYNRPQFDFKWEKKKLEMVATCPKCGNRGTWEIKDKMIRDSKAIRIKMWNPKEIKIKHCENSEESRYYWDIPESYKRDVRRGEEHILENVSIPVLECIRNNGIFKFNDGAILHMRNKPLLGYKTDGWGVPSCINNYRQIIYTKLLQMQNESIVRDHIKPIRLITPLGRSGAGGSSGMGMTTDVLSTFNMDDVSSQIDEMIQNRNRKPDDWYSLPFPIDYHLIGGDAKDLAPTELIDQAFDKLLNDIGVPPDMYRGSLALQSEPTALRLFQSFWRELVSDSNKMSQWIFDQVSMLLNWQRPKAKLRKVTVADDIEKQGLLLQLMMSGKASETTAFRAIGVNWSDEQELIKDETSFRSEMQDRVNKEMEQAGVEEQMLAPPPEQQGGQPGAAPGGIPPEGVPAGGMGGPQGGGLPQAGGIVASYLAQLQDGTSQTPEDQIGIAEAIANDLMGQPTSIKNSELRQLKQSNEIIHGVVISRMEEARRQLRLQGGAMLQQQMYGGQGQPA